MNDRDPQILLDIATLAAMAGGQVLKKYWGKLRRIEEKAPGDLVTVADHESETAILEVLNRYFPGHAILAEESGIQGNKDSAILWVIDPLDGTTNFAHQYPMSSVSIGVLVEGVPTVGAIYDPFRDELFVGGLGLGAFVEYQGERCPIHVSNCRELKHSLLVTGFAYDRTRTIDNNYAEFCHFTHISHGVRRGGSAALDLAYIAAGRLDGYWERGLSPWDMAAGVALVRSAGGIVTAYDGSPYDLYSGRILAANPYLHPQMVEELAKVKPLTQSFPFS
ncbi:MAG: inositol monophosphatase family protein [Pseudanabaenaceae cyanobacterium SKYGB_i_bin29]|nr:inositol monophosphatase [Pseudanabaenaceae cyanobacterium SKYG29]MDW8421071.1 inositol monophosphatase family protein [Pseudanabaenaceae cyanobacterium SKYGB_i_bin29]